MKVKSNMLPWLQEVSYISAVIRVCVCVCCTTNVDFLNKTSHTFGFSSPLALFQNERREDIDFPQATVPRPFALQLELLAALLLAQLQKGENDLSAAVLGKTTRTKCKGHVASVGNLILRP